MERASTFCIPRPRASPDLISVSCRARAARTSRALLAAGMDLTCYLLGADEIDLSRLGICFRRLSGQPRRPRRAARRRHPSGRRLHGKERHLRQHRRARADDGKAPFSRQAAPRKTGQSSANCRQRAGNTLPYDTIAALRAAMYRCRPAARRSRYASRRARRPGWRRSPNSRAGRAGAFCIGHRGLLSDQPDRARLRRHGRDERAQEDHTNSKLSAAE